MQITRLLKSEVAVQIKREKFWKKKSCNMHLYNMNELFASVEETRSCKYRCWGDAGINFFWKRCCMNSEMWVDILSWWKVQDLLCQGFNLLCRTNPLLNDSRTIEENREEHLDIGLEPSGFLDGFRGSFLSRTLRIVPPVHIHVMTFSSRFSTSRGAKSFP